MDAGLGGCVFVILLVLFSSQRLNNGFGCKEVMSGWREDMLNHLLHQLRSEKSSKAEIKL